jgi:phage repressor protein C with HTH and peptisase S24 domain
MASISFGDSITARGHIASMEKLDADVARGRRIKAAREAKQLTQDQLASRVSEHRGTPVSRGAVGNWELGLGLTTVNLGALSEVLGVRQDWFLTGDGPGPASATAYESGNATEKNGNFTNKIGVFSSPVPHTLGGPPTLPVLGAAKGGKGGIFMQNGEAFDYVQRPSFLSDARDAYAVYMVGDSMEPRYFAGETLFVHPHKPVRQGDFVVVQLAPEVEGGEAEYLVKQFVRQDQKRLQVREYQPKERVFDVPAGRVIAAHKIVGSAETA